MADFTAAVQGAQHVVQEPACPLEMRYAQADFVSTPPYYRRRTGEYVYFAVVIFIALMLIMVVLVNFQFGASFFVFLMLVAMLIYCIIGVVFLLLAVVGHDE